MEWGYLKNWNYGGHERSYESEYLYYILAMKDERNSNSTKLSCVQQIFILLLLTKHMSNQEVNCSYHAL